MTNRILTLEVRDRLSDPAEPELSICVVAELASAALEVRGRLMGPRCIYASTVEVAYPLRPFPRPPEGRGIYRRVVIPEASLWEPACPFLYQGPVELWDEGRLCDQVMLTRGLRYLNVGKRGLRLNGRALTLRGLVRNDASASELTKLREQGYNTLLADVTVAPTSLWEAADRIGLALLGRVPASIAAIEQAVLRRGHPSNLGWVLAPAILAEPDLRAAATPLLKRLAGEMIGLDAVAAPKVVPPEVQFLFGPPDLTPDLPRIILGAGDVPAAADLLGVIRP